MSADRLRVELTRIASRQARIDRRARAIRLLAITIALIGALSLADALLGLTPALRIASLIALAGFLLASIVALIARTSITDPALHHAARRAGERALSAYEFSKRSEQGEIASELAHRTVARALESLATKDTAALVNRASLRRATAALRYAAIFALCIELALPRATPMALTRITDPAHYHPQWSTARFSVQIAPDDLLAGDNVTLTSRVEGGAGPVEVIILEDNTASPSIRDIIPLVQNAEQPTRWHTALRDVRARTYAALRRGDAMSDLITIDPEQTPRIQRAWASIQSPEASERIVNLTPGAPTTIAAAPDDVIRIAMETSIAPTGVEGADDLPANLRPDGAEVTIAPGPATDRALALAPVGPSGAPSPTDLQVTIRRIDTLAGAAPALADAGDIANATNAPGQSPTDEAPVASNPESAGAPTDPTGATPTIAQGGATEGPNRIARDENASPSLETASLETLQQRAVEVIRVGAPDVAPWRAQHPPIPERYRDLAARFFRRVVRDDIANESNP